MQRPPSIAEAPKVPVTALLCGGAILVSLGSMHNPGLVGMLATRAEMPPAEAWRFVTSILPHGSPAHLLFNLWWTWTLGAALERAFGHAKFMAFVVLAAAISSGAEWLLLSGGIGLSGVVYAMFGVLWSLRHKSRYAGVVDRQTFNLFIAWFFVCIVLTYTNLMAVANIAHGMGLVVGLVVGEGIKSTGARRGAWAGLVVLMLAVIGGAGWTVREKVSLSNIGLGDARDSIELATKAIRENRTQDAIRHMERALKDEPEMAQWWSVLAGLYHMAGRMDDARRAADKAVRLDPSDVEMQEYLRSLEASHEAESAPAPAESGSEGEPGR